MAEAQQLASVYQTAERCKSEGIGFSYKRLLAAAKSGEIPVVRSGSRYLLMWSNVLKFAEGVPVEPVYKVRRKCG